MRLFRHSHWAACLPLCCWLSVSQLPSTCSLCAGVICSGGSGDDGGEPPGCAAADSAVHHEQVSLCGDIQRTTLSPVHCWDNGQLPLHAQVEFTDISWASVLNRCALFPLHRGSTFPAFSLCSSRWLRSTFTIYSTTSIARKNWRWEDLSHRAECDYHILFQRANNKPWPHTLPPYSPR